MNTRTKLPAEERRAATVDAVIELAAGHDPGEITTTVIAKHIEFGQGNHAGLGLLFDLADRATHAVPFTNLNVI